MEIIVNIAQLLSSSHPDMVIHGTPELCPLESPAFSTVVLFDGREDQIVIPGNPLSKAREFTLEALFFPFAEGEEEQRFVHLQNEEGEDRILLETRLTEDRQHWYGDTIIAAGDGMTFLNDPEKLHPTGGWATMALYFANGQMEQWVNGQQELTAPAEYHPWSTGRISLGQRLNRVSPFAGSLAALRFADFSRAPQDLWQPSEFALPNPR
ncbi:MAG: LamG domain-containing protein [Opitutales bacterium]|nr:LamG domain-containing protein [Opitutales bacterium]